MSQLIARRVREAGVYCEIVPFQSADEAFKRIRPKGVILSGGNVDLPRYAELLAKLEPKGIRFTGVNMKVHRVAERLDHSALSGDLIRQAYNEKIQKARLDAVKLRLDAVSAAKKEAAAILDGARAEHDQLARVVGERKEDREVECEVRLYRVDRRRVTVRLDTGEEIDSIPVTDDEMRKGAKWFADLGVANSGGTMRSSGMAIARPCSSRSCTSGANIRIGSTSTPWSAARRACCS